MILINICYIIIAVGVSKILTFYTLDFALMTNLPQKIIYNGLTLGSWGSLLGKFVCGYFIYRMNYKKLLISSFVLMAVCLVIEFMGIISFNVITYSMLRMFQGFISGIIYSTILANLGEFYVGEKYQKLVSILTGGLGLAGPMFGFLYIICPFKIIIKCMFLVPIIASIICYFSVKNKNITLKTKLTDNSLEAETDPTTKEKKNFMYYLKIIRDEKYLSFFALSFAFALICSLLILSNLNRLFILYLESKNIKINSIIIRLCSVLPLLFGSLCHFVKKKYGNLIGVFICIVSIFIINLFLQSIFLYFIFYILCYGLHLILLPYVSSLVLSLTLDNKDYYSYIIHALRSLFYSILILVFFGKIYFNTIRDFSIYCVAMQILAAIFYFIGKYFLDKKH